MNTHYGTAEEFDAELVARLVRQAQQGNKVSFDKLMARYEVVVRKIALRYVESADVNDFVQEVFIKGWRHLPSIEEPEKFGGWISTITHHMAIDYLRQKKSRTQKMTVNYSQDRQKADELSVQGPEDDIIDQDNTYHIYDLLRESLKEKYYLCIVLYAHGFTNEEIASRVGISVKSVPIYLSQARKVMRPILEPLRKVQKGGKQ